MIVRYLFAALALLTVAACTSPGLQTTITDISYTATNDPSDPRNCGSAYILLLTVTDGGKEIVKDRECGFPFYTSAKAFKDRRGHIYVFRVAASTDGTGLQPQDVHIERFDPDHGRLYDVVTLTWSEPDAPDGGLWDTTYHVSDTEAGGLQATFTYAPPPNPRCCTPPEKQVTVRLGSVSAGGSTPIPTALEAVVRPAPPETWCNGRGQGFEMVTIAVTDGGRTLAHESECRYPGETLSGQAFVDRRGRIYMLVQMHWPTPHSKTGNASDTLSIAELQDIGPSTASYSDPYIFAPMGDILLSPAEDPAARWPTTYRVRNTEGGGLEVIVDYSPVKSDGCCRPPERQVSVQFGP